MTAKDQENLIYKLQVMTKQYKANSYEDWKLVFEFYTKIRGFTSNYELTVDNFETFPYIVIHEDSKCIHFEQREFGRAVNL